MSQFPCFPLPQSLLLMCQTSPFVLGFVLQELMLRQAEGSPGGIPGLRKLFQGQSDSYGRCSIAGSLSGFHQPKHQARLSGKVSDLSSPKSAAEQCDSLNTADAVLIPKIRGNLCLEVRYMSVWICSLAPSTVNLRPVPSVEFPVPETLQEICWKKR